MKTIARCGGVAIALVAALSLGAGAARADNATAELNSFHSVPTLARSGDGSLKAKLRSSKGAIDYTLAYEGMDSPVLQAHIHFGNAWENGGVIAFLCTNLGNAPSPGVPPCPVEGGEVSGRIEAAHVIGPGGDRGIPPGDLDAVFAAIESQAVYVNVHTAAFPAGHIRGQLHGH